MKNEKATKHLIECVECLSSSDDISLTEHYIQEHQDILWNLIQKHQWRNREK